MRLKLILIFLSLGYSSCLLAQKHIDFESLDSIVVEVDKIEGENLFDINTVLNYINGKLNGIEICYNDNKIVMKRNYYNGKLQGDSIFNDENEKILKYQYYQNGKLIYSKSFNSELEECCICFENTNFKLKCDHNVCFNCKDKIHKCPICRRFITFI